MKRKNVLTHVGQTIATWPREYVATLPDLPTSKWRWQWNFIDKWFIEKLGKKPITRLDWMYERKRLIAKPSWKDAPDWATHLDQCDNGWWRWSKRDDPGITKWMMQGGGKIPAGHDYTRTTEKRPWRVDVNEPSFKNACKEAAKIMQEFGNSLSVSVPPPHKPAASKASLIDEALELVWDRQDEKIPLAVRQVVRRMIEVGYRKP